MATQESDNLAHSHLDDFDTGVEIWATLRKTSEHWYFAASRTAIRMVRETDR